MGVKEYLAVVGQITKELNRSNIARIQGNLLDMDPNCTWEPHQSLVGYVVVVMHHDGKVFAMSLLEDDYNHWAAVLAAALELMT